MDEMVMGAGFGIPGIVCLRPIHKQFALWVQCVCDLRRHQRMAPMSSYTATIRWTRDPRTDFAKGQYSRVHEWAFDGGAVVPASASPHVVPAPWSDPHG